MKQETIFLMNKKQWFNKKSHQKALTDSRISQNEISLVNNTFKKM